MTFQRILAVQVKMIGDLLLTLPALRRLREEYPDAQLEVLTLGPAAQLGPCVPWLDAVHGWDKRRMNVSTLRPLLGGTRPDLTLDFSGTDRAALFTTLGRQRIGYRKYARDRRFRKSIYTQTSKSILKRQHASRYYLGLLEPLGLAPTEDGEPPKIEFVIPEFARREAELALHHAGVDAPYIALQPGSARVEKFWSARQWSKLIHELSERGHRVVILGGNAPTERDHLERIELLSLPDQPVNLGGKLSLPASVAVLAEAEALIGVDSALMHLAAELRLPQLAMFSTTAPTHWGPWNPRALCLHASQPDDPRPTRQWEWQEDLPETPLRKISVKQVLSAFDHIETSDHAGDTG